MSSGHVPGHVPEHGRQADIGLSKHPSAHGQLVAALPQEDFDAAAYATLQTFLPRSIPRTEILIFSSFTSETQSTAS
jgi:hypothetical protein